MKIKVELTGREDREGPWKMLLAGFGGAGKTLTASTADEPLFVFFTENPKFKSIANRAVPHVKITNELDADGKLVMGAHDKLLALLSFLEIKDHKYNTLVLDTGNDLFQVMKAARKLRNSGEFGPGDWGWLADTYCEVLAAVLDADMDVIVLYHLKNESLDEGVTYRELNLQGSITPDVPTWFDVVGVLDTFEVINDDGESVTRRSILTHASRLYPWLKDHSGTMPRRFELSEGFVGDFPRMKAMWVEEPGAPKKETLDEIPTEKEDPPEKSDETPVPSPEELEEKKVESRAEQSAPEPEETPVSDPPEAPIPSEAKAEVKAPEAEEPEQGEKLPAEEEVSTAEAVENVTEALDAQEVKTCVVCSEEIDDGMYDISQIRFRKPLCRDHYRAELEAANA